MQKNMIFTGRRERDAVVEYWLSGEVAASYDAMKADPSRGISVDSAFASVRDRHAERTRAVE
jgi:antitoxin ParD1/3/4